MPHLSDDADTEVTIDSLQIAGDPDCAFVTGSAPADNTSSVIDFTFVSHGPGLMAVTFYTPNGEGFHHLTYGSSSRLTTGAAGGCSSRRARSTAPSPPAIIGSSSPAIAIGMAATL